MKLKLPSKRPMCESHWMLHGFPSALTFHEANIVRICFVCIWLCQAKIRSLVLLVTFLSLHEASAGYRILGFRRDRMFCIQGPFPQTLLVLTVLGQDGKFGVACCAESVSSWGPSWAQVPGFQKRQAVLNTDPFEQILLVLTVSGQDDKFGVACSSAESVSSWGPSWVQDPGLQKRLAVLDTDPFEQILLVLTVSGQDGKFGVACCAESVSSWGPSWAQVPGFQKRQAVLNTDPFEQILLVLTVSGQDDKFRVACSCAESVSTWDPSWVQDPGLQKRQDDREQQGAAEQRILPHRWEPGGRRRVDQALWVPQQQFARAKLGGKQECGGFCFGFDSDQALWRC